MKRLQQIYFFQGRKFGLSVEDSEDYSSCAIIKVLEGRKCNNSHMLVDWLRKHKGDSRQSENVRRFKNPVSYEDYMKGVEDDL
jgi:hypothetical protein